MKLPYFRWFPADAETDEAYSALDDRELGFFHRCLNRSWINDGLPSGLDELARTMRVSRVYLDKLWPRVSKLFQESDSRIFNRRQEEERTHAKSKSEKATESVRTRYVRTIERNSDDLPRALARAESECVSESVSVFLPRKESAERKPLAEASMRFAEFWAVYPLKDQPENLVAGVWLGLVTVADEEKVFACLHRYLSSDQVARAVVLKATNWLHDCSRAKWACEWPARAAPKNGAPPGYEGLTQVEADKKYHREQEALKAARKEANGNRPREGN